MKKSLLFHLGLLFAAGSLPAQTPASFQRLGSQEETVQDLFPGSHNARPVMADFTNNGYLDLFYGGQDVGGSAKYFFEEEVNSDNRWGDQGNGRYINPVLNADYSDPDIIRVGNKYYMVCSEFHYMGMPILESDDMLNWKIITQVYDKLDFPKYDTSERYGGGSWAPALRYHNGKFWVFFCTPDEGLFMSNATDAAGPWSPPVHVKNVSGWEDPCPFWDEDGQAYLGRSQLGAGPIFLHKMKADGTELLDNGVKVYEGPVAEGTKIHKKDGYYYFSIPEGGVSTGWQTVLRAKNIYGPYDVKKVLEQGNTDINGPHQGSLVDTPEGEWWFYHFQSREPVGRVVHLQPVSWEKGWPLVGLDLDGNGIGEPVKEWTIPNTGHTGSVFAPQASDDFDATGRGWQWQINHNPVNTHWSLAERPGYLRLKALKAGMLRESKNMFTQKVMGYESEASVEMDCSQTTDGQRAGIFCIGNQFNAAGIERKNGQNYIYFEHDGNVTQIAQATVSIIYLKIALNANTNRHRFYYSFDNETFLPCGEAFTIRSGDWKGIRIGLFSYNTESDTGIADFNWFNYRFDGAGGVTLPHNPDLDQHGNPNWNDWNEQAALVKNNGDGTFTVVPEKKTGIAFSKNSNAVFFDYDNDGNLDLLLSGQVGGWPRGGNDSKFVKLYRNLGEEGNYLFSEIQDTGFRPYNDEDKYFNMISVGDYDHDGYNDVLLMSRDNNGRRVDLYRNDAGTGVFVLQSNGFISASNGAVTFGDLDNDGWLDILYTGDNNWGSIRTYRNKQDGSFEENTPNNLTGSFDSQSTLADMNGDGRLDIIVTGHIQDWGRISSIYYNTFNAQTGQPEYHSATSSETGIAAVNKSNLLAADFNNDGRMDLVMNGETGNASRNRVYYQKADGKFLLDTTYPLSSTRDGGIAMGDVNGDGNMDVLIAGYKASGAADPSYDSPVRLYENRPAVNNMPPTAPASVRATYNSGKLTITWDPATDDISASEALRYNLYVKNNTTGKIWMMIPADIQSGRIKAGTDLQIALSSSVHEYSLSPLPFDNYTVGVQALDQSYAGGPFTVCNAATGIISVSEEPLRSIRRVEDGIIVKSEKSETVEILNMNGQLLMQSMTNTQIQLFHHGFYIVKVNNKHIKFIF